MAINQRRVDEIVNICHDLQSKFPISVFSQLPSENFLQEDFRARWDELCGLVSETGPIILADLISDKLAARMLSFLPEYVERRVLYTCPPCEFQKSIYSEHAECASFQKFVVGEEKYGGDAPELGLDVTDRTISFFVREDKKRLISRDAFMRLSMFVRRVDDEFKEIPRGRLNQYRIVDDNSYDDVEAYVKRVAKIVAALSDAKEGITKALFKV